MTRGNLSAWAISHRPVVYYFMLVLVVIGIASYMRLGRNEDPTFTIKTMVVETRHAAAGHRTHRAQAAGNAAP
jgi:multidrug efflux pump subunit AcrB